MWLPRISPMHRWIPGMDTAEDLCDYLLRTNKITEKEYKEKLKIH